jgi:hypothetical protein
MPRKHATESMDHHQRISIHSNEDRECCHRSKIEKWIGNKTEINRPVKGGHDV